MIRYSIEELCQKVNDFVKHFNDSAATEVSDKRVKDELSIRRIRDYYSKGLMSESIKEGRNAYYDDNHVKQLLALKLLQNEGITENYIKRQINIFDELELDQFLMSKNIVVNDEQVSHVTEAQLNQINNNVSIQGQNSLLTSPSFASESQVFVAYTQDVQTLGNQEQNVSQTSYSTNKTNSSSAININSLSVGMSSIKNQEESDYEKQQKAMALINNFKNNQESNLYSKSLSNFKKRATFDNGISTATQNLHTDNSLIATEYKEYQVHEAITLKVKLQHDTQNLTQKQKEDVLQKIRQILNI